MADVTPTLVANTASAVTHALSRWLAAILFVGLAGLLLLSVNVLVLRHEFRLQRAELTSVKEQQLAISYIVCANPNLDTASADGRRLRCSHLPGLVRRTRPTPRNDP